MHIASAFNFVLNFFVFPHVNQELKGILESKGSAMHGNVLAHELSGSSHTKDYPLSNVYLP